MVSFNYNIIYFLKDKTWFIKGEIEIKEREGKCNVKSERKEKRAP